MPKNKSSNSTNDKPAATANKTALNMRKKKKSKFVKIDVEFGQSASATMSSVSMPPKVRIVGKPWWEVWEESQSVRSLFYDQDMMPFQRVSEATMIFNKFRVWPSTEPRVRNRWDQFQVYAGLLENAAGDDFVRLSTFVQNPARAIQIYLSSYFIEKGLHFSNYNCDIIPKLLYFYVQFLLVNDVLPDKGDDLHYAMSIIETAKIELAVFHSIGVICPDHFNLTCKELLCNDSNVTLHIAGNSPPANAGIDTQTQDLNSAEISLAASNKTKKKSKAKKEYTFQTAKGKPIELPTHSDSAPSVSVPITSGWGASVVSQSSSWGEGTSSGWGSSGNSVVSGWDAILNNTTPAPPEDNGWGNFNAPPSASSFVSSNITSTLPKTHVRGVVEHSVRRVKAIMPPTGQTVVNCKQEDDPVALEDELKRCYWTVVLAPWPIEGAQEFATILSFSKGNVNLCAEGQVIVEEGSVNDLYVGNVVPHDCVSDDITIFVEAEAGKVLRVGMGLGGSWAQLLRASDCTQGVQKHEDQDGPNASRYWFMLELLRILPTYYVV
ncbi:hypothetical protein F5890DRAFT_1554469 [Lentinula detonsa]|uniref:Uncharacterized protein n=1 Tax=Lentinula detonsa TaxID=2804962 RepID=A0AA38PZF4_9AGAR|nr:hypothetical protein F5890DRAFT_1554469 [Lentinula detonsa]